MACGMCPSSLVESVVGPPLQVPEDINIRMLQFIDIALFSPAAISQDFGCWIIMDVLPEMMAEQNPESSRQAQTATL